MTTYNKTDFDKLVRKVLKATKDTDAIVVGGLAVRHHGYDRITVIGYLMGNQLWP